MSIKALTKKPQEFHSSITQELDANNKTLMRKLQNSSTINKEALTGSSMK